MDFLFALIWFPLESSLAIYSALFAVLILSGIGLPMPEEATLLFGGYLAYLGFINFWRTFYVLAAGIIVADMLGYVLGRFAGKWVSGKLIRFQTSTVMLAKAKNYFDRHGEKMVLFSRPLLGIRVAVPILAGHFKMNFLKFLVFDAMAALPWTFILVSLSYYFGAGLDLITEAREIKHAIFFLFGLAILLFTGVKFLKNNKASVV